MAERGGAAAALPLLLWLGLGAAGLRAEANAFGNLNMASQEEAPHLDAAGMALMARPESLDDVPAQLGFPATGAQFSLYGAGATFSKGALRLGVQGLLGGLGHRQGAQNTEWRLRLGNLVMEQRYPYGQFLVTAGALLSYGQLEGLLEDGSLLTRYDGQAYGGGLLTGARWPRQTRLGFMLRAGYVWLPFSGAWKGDQAAKNPKTAIDLGGPLGQAQLELSF